MGGGGGDLFLYCFECLMKVLNSFPEKKNYTHVKKLYTFSRASWILYFSHILTLLPRIYETLIMPVLKP